MLELDDLITAGELVQVTPQHVVHDRHPGYRSTRWAQRSGLPVTGVLAGAMYALSLYSFVWVGLARIPR